jgi:peroxisomal 3,2-trans-enoyl-CoA isomerase
MASIEQQVTYRTQGTVAIITLNIPQKLNALNQDLYFRIATLLNDVAKDDNIRITLLTGKGRFFSA